MKKRDIILAAVLLIIAALLFFLLPKREMGGEVRITVDGQLYGVYSLFLEQELVIEQESGKNILHLGNGAAWMEEADCPDGYCIQQGKIRRAGQTIVCLPHKLVIEVIGENGENLSPDAIVQ